MDFGFTGMPEVSEKDLATVGRFIHRCGLLEHAVDAFIKLYSLVEDVNRENKKKRKSLDDKIRVLNRYCHRIKKEELRTKEFNRAKKIQKNIQKYEKQNGIRDLRNAIAHNPILVSVMGAWQPGPGYVKPFPNKVKIKSGESVEVLTTWSFAEIQTLSEELLAMLLEMGYQPKDPV